MTTLSGNKGEWSEIYVFLRLLSIGKLYAADENLQKKHDVFLDIINIIRTEDIGLLEFNINKNDKTIEVSVNHQSQILPTISQETFKIYADKLFDEIIYTTGSSFSIQAIETFLNELKIKTLKAKSVDKSDIRIKIHDINTGYKALQGFSIKSRLGSASTLINASKATTFIYTIDGQITDEIMEKFNKKEKFDEKAQILLLNNCFLSYFDMKNSIFKNNLLLIDADLPKICAVMLEYSIVKGTKKITEILQLLKKNNPLHYDLSHGHPFYEYKFKKFLTDSALGMLPATTWNGIADATGGYIIVREDGEVLCYHLFNRNDFENYLINSTKFDTPSTSRHDFGYIYKDKDTYYLNLNLQIRFIE